MSNFSPASPPRTDRQPAAAEPRQGRRTHFQPHPVDPALAATAFLQGRRHAAAVPSRPSRESRKETESCSSIPKKMVSRRKFSLFTKNICRSPKERPISIESRFTLSPKEAKGFFTFLEMAQQQQGGSCRPEGPDHRPDHLLHRGCRSGRPGHILQRPAAGCGRQAAGPEGPLAGSKNAGNNRAGPALFR